MAYPEEGENRDIHENCTSHLFFLGQAQKAGALDAWLLGCFRSFLIWQGLYIRAGDLLTLGEFDGAERSNQENGH